MAEPDRTRNSGARTRPGEDNRAVELGVAVATAILAPFQYSMVAFCDSLVAYIRVLDFAGMIAQWSMEWLPIAGNPNLKIYRNGGEHAEEFQMPHFKIGARLSRRISQ
jgi:hypothetical protein